jgi:hypothetical protein
LLLLPILSALIVAAAIAWVGGRISRELVAHRGDRDQIARLLGLFATGVAAVAEDPRALLTWQPLATTARKLYPKEFAALDQASGTTFPFNADQIERAHSRWTADWLAWERAHDADCKLKAATIEHELGDAVGSAYGRARLDAVEREKLDRYQQRYEEYTRVGKGLQALIARR